jgi:hypothetical protein
MSISVAEMIDRALEDSEEVELFAECKALLESFVRNNYVSLRWNPEEDVPANMARVKPPGLYVFDFRSKGDDGGIRVFGCFAAKDHFVAIRWEYRMYVDWDADPKGCIEEWTSLFGYAPPSLGRNPNDYLSANYHIARANR